MATLERSAPPPAGPGLVPAAPTGRRSAGQSARLVLRAVVHRLVAAAVVVLGAATLAFLGLALLPGDPVARLLGPVTTASPAVRAQIRHDYLFDRPVAVQYLHYLDSLVHLRMGESYQLQQPVSALLADALGPTAQLAGAALALALVGALVVAVATAGRRRGWRAAATVVELVAVSTPSFWLGIVLLTIFSFHFRIFPVAGADSVSSLVLPAITLALPVGGVLSQVLREGLETALAEPFVITARARGLRESAVRMRHAVRHAALPLVTLTGWLTGTLLGGAVPVETVFGRPGVGALVLDAVLSRDMPVVMAVVVFSALLFVVLSTLVDLVYLAVDPRLRTVAVAV
ncbi:peptide/nickel transport system permease protein [Frankia sp. AiPs1]|uniref:ABC transporter permease n=1 Tax=Frankia sp. AiPa1 TaxID=573492 RepID=UPI00202B6C89|nr:ABC transporter permease [Frankia sp. AiPa1]MCL9762477.1 ABC transporter permease [Frankia sp. AiPa1]